MKSIFEQMGGTYSLGEDGMYYPNLQLSEGEKPHYGKFGMLRKTFLKEHRKGQYSVLLLEGRLTKHLNEIDDMANTKTELLIRQMQERWNVNEELKVSDQFAWISLMNNIRNVAEENVLKELIHV